MAVPGAGVYRLDTAAQTAGTNKVYNVAEETKANIAFVEKTALDFQSRNLGETARAAWQAAQDLITTCKAEEANLTANGEALGKSQIVITSSDSDTSGIFAGTPIST